MKNKIKTDINIGFDAFCDQVKLKKRIYSKLLDLAGKDKSESKIFKIIDKRLFEEVITNFGAALDSNKAEHELDSIYEIGLHKETGTLIICNKGATLYSLSPKKQIPHLIRHIGFCLY